MICSYSGRYSSGFTASSGVFVSIDSGLSWIDRSDPRMQYWTQDLIVDPFDSTQGTWYVGVFSGWGGAPNGLGGLYRTTDRGINWSRIGDMNRVYSCTFNPQNRNQMFITSEAEGLWFSHNIRDVIPTIEQVQSYKFAFPGRVFFNPYNTNEVWITSFGNGIMVGEMSSATDVKPFKRITYPLNFRLDAYPNPFNPSVHIDFHVPKKGDIKIRIFNISGQHIKTLVDDAYGRGSYSVSWDATNRFSKKVPSGVYICQILLDHKFRKAVRLILGK